MANLPHMPWPFQLAATVQQDSLAEHQAATAVIVLTAKGYRDDNPDFGVTSPVFATRPLDTARLAREVADSDPRLSPTATEIAAFADQITRIVITAGQPATGVA